MAVDDSDSDDELLMKDADASWTKVRGTITNARDAIAKIQKEFGTHVKPRADGAGPSSAPPKSRSARDPAAAALSGAAVALSDAALVFATVPDSSDKENAPAASEAAKSSPADDDEIVVTGHSGIRGALNDFPHARSLCATFPLATHPPRTSCPNCFCFVCETPAPCASWGAGDAPDADHCLASERDQTWRARRDAERAKRADAAPNAAAAGGDAEDQPPVLGAHAPQVGDAGDDGDAAAEVNAEDVANILDGLRDAEATEERDVPEGSLKVTLMKHQRRALAWAMKKEANARCRGGILADDQGLGKTVSMMAVIVSAPPSEREAKPGAHVLRRRRAIGDLGRDRGWTIERRRSDPAGAGAGTRGSLEPPPAAAAPPHLPGCVCDACKLAKRAKRSAAKERERKRGVALAFGDSDDEDAMAAKERHERREAQRAAARLSGGDARRGVGGVGPGKVPARTLVVCPAIVMQQWKDELDEKSNLRSVVYHGAARSRLDEATLLAHDVVVTTYGVVCGEFRVSERDGTVGALFNLSWHRVILDEAHIIRNRRTYGSVSVSALQARCRWCLSGTPLMNSADDVYPLFRFLRYQPFASWPHFNDVISRDANRVGGGGHRAIGAMTRLRVAMRAVTLRRTKATLIDGRPIVDLPPRVVEDRVVVFDAAERDFYDALENNVGVAFDTFVRRGWKANYMHILVLLLQLRQACDHPLLIKGARGGGFENGEDGDENGNGFASKADLIAALGADRVVALEKAMREYRQCDICYGPCENPSATAPCGHGPTCAECMRTALQANMQATGRDFGACPQCRGAVDERNGILSLEALAPGRGGNRAAGGDDSDDEADFRNVDAADVVARVLAKARRRAEVLGRKLEAEAAAEAARKGKAPEEKPREEAQVEAAPIANSAKIRAILEELGKTRDEAPEGTLPEQTIVFSQFVAFLDMLEPEVAREHAVLRLDGRQTLGTRANVVQAFRRGEASVLLVSLKAASLGLNLNCASRVIIADPWWNAAVEDQAIDRCHRIGQTRPVRVLKMIVHGSVERRVQHLQERKRAIADAALGDGEQVVAALRQRLNLRDLHDLFGRERPVRDGGHAGGADGVRCKCRLARCKTCICATVGHACTALCGCGGRCANAERR